MTISNVNMKCIHRKIQIYNLYSFAGLHIVGGVQNGLGGLGWEVILVLMVS